MVYYNGEMILNRHNLDKLLIYLSAEQVKLHGNLQIVDKEVVEKLKKKNQRL